LQLAGVVHAPTVPPAASKRGRRVVICGRALTAVDQVGEDVRGNCGRTFSNPIAGSARRIRLEKTGAEIAAGGSPT
jgi:hypothetical protein